LPGSWELPGILRLGRTLEPPAQLEPPGPAGLFGSCELPRPLELLRIPELPWVLKLRGPLELPRLLELSWSLELRGSLELSWVLELSWSLELRGVLELRSARECTLSRCRKLTGKPARLSTGESAAAWWRRCRLKRLGRLERAELPGGLRLPAVPRWCRPRLRTVPAGRPVSGGAAVAAFLAVAALTRVAVRLRVPIGRPVVGSALSLLLALPLGLLALPLGLLGRPRGLLLGAVRREPGVRRRTCHGAGNPVAGALAVLGRVAASRLTRPRRARTTGGHHGGLGRPARTSGVPGRIWRRRHG
jgi:hypothetical protein